MTADPRPDYAEDPADVFVVPSYIVLRRTRIRCTYSVHAPGQFVGWLRGIDSSRWQFRTPTGDWRGAYPLRRKALFALLTEGL
jgi:hypothetical protein